MGFVLVKPHKCFYGSGLHQSLKLSSHESNIPLISCFNNCNYHMIFSGGRHSVVEFSIFEQAEIIQTEITPSNIVTYCFCCSSYAWLLLHPSDKARYFAAARHERPQNPPSIHTNADLCEIRQKQGLAAARIYAIIK